MSSITLDETECLIKNTHKTIKKLVSVVVPVYNEESTINKLYQRLVKISEDLKNQYNFEFVFVDDGSRDRTLGIIETLALSNPKLKVVELRRNYGQTAAIQAGLDIADGDIIISMDADLQHFPEEIPKFLDKIEQGYDVICGWRYNRQEGIIRKWPSKFANYLIRRISGLKINDIGTTFRAYRKEIAKDITLFGENHRFIPVFAKVAGAKIDEIPIQNIERPYGQSNYGLNRTLNVFFDLFFLYFFVRYLDRPMRIFGKIALANFMFGFSICTGLSYLWLFYDIPVIQHSGWFILAMVLFITSLQLLLTGVIAELLIRVYFFSNQQDTYKIRKIISLKTN